MESTPNNESIRAERPGSEQLVKRVKFGQAISTDTTDTIATPITTSSQALTEAKLSHGENSTPLSAKEPAEGKRRTWTLPKTKRASSLNLHNHPAISHPVGIAIWLLQKIDQARKSNSSDDERSPSTSMPPSPGRIQTSTEVGVYGARIDRPDPGTSFSFKPSSLTGAQPLWGQASLNEHEDDTARRRAQRDRKTKQRIENWAKNKENDVVARAKLEAKKKYGTHDQQEMVRKRFVDERVKDDYGRLLGRQTAQFADALAQLGPFRVGHSDEFVRSNLHRFGFHHSYVQAGKLLLDVLPALAEPQVSDRSQRAADALLAALENGAPDELSFFSFIDVLSDDETIQQGIDKVLGQLINARPEERRPSRSQASPGGGQSACPAFSASPDSAGLPLKKLTWKEPATLKDNNFRLLNNTVPPTDGRKDSRQPLGSFGNALQSIILPPSQADFTPTSSPSPYSTPPTTMAPPLPAQARSSGRERKPTAKVLAAGAEGPSRQPATPPSVLSRPTLTSNSKSAPRVPSKLGLSELIADKEETPPTKTPPTTGQYQHDLPEETSSTATTAVQHDLSPNSSSTPTRTDQHSLSSTIHRPFVPPIIPRSLQQVPSNVPPKVDSQPALDPELTANLLQLAEIAAYMSDSDDDDEEDMESYDLPVHEHLIRELQRQETGWHVTTSTSMERRAKPMEAAILPSASHSQTMPAIAAPAQTASLPPVNTTMSIKEAQAASEFFKSLVAGESEPKTQPAQPGQAETTNLQAATDKRTLPTHSLNGGNTTTSGIGSSGKQHSAGNGGYISRLPETGAQIGPAPSRLLSSKTHLSALNTNTNGHGTVVPQLSQPESRLARVDRATLSPDRLLLPLDRKRKYEDEGNDIAMNRLRTHAASRGVRVDLTMSFEQLNALIDQHDRVGSYALTRANGSNISQIPSGSNNRGQTNGTSKYGSTAPDLVLNRPPSAEGLRRLAPISPWPGSNQHYPPYNALTPIPRAARYPPRSHDLSHPDALRSPIGHISNNYGKALQFVPSKQSEQFSRQNSPIPNKSPSASNAEDPRQQHQDALNGGPPGGGAVINSRTSKRQQSGTANYKVYVKGKETSVAQSQPKRGGQLMNFS